MAWLAAEAGLSMEILPGPPDVLGSPSPEDRLMLLPPPPTPSSHIVHHTYPVSVLYAPRSIQSLNINTLFHASVPLYVPFPSPGSPVFFLSLSYIYLQELAKYFLSHGHSSNCIPSHIRGRSNCFLICDVVLESESQVRFLSLLVNAVRSWTYYLTSLCSKFLSRVMGIITITIPSLTKL